MTLKRLLGALTAFALAFSFLTYPAEAQSAGTTVSGKITTESGVPLAAAAVTLRGPATYSTTSDARGAYAFAVAVPGSYLLSASKGGYQTVEVSVVVAGTPVPLDVALPIASFSSLRRIAVTTAVRSGNFNTSTASVNVVSSATIAEQGALQVFNILNEVPGVQISFPGSDANGASRGAIVIPNVRNGLSYETASLVDGHPLSVGLYGDYVVTFLNPDLLQNVEVVKGPGAMPAEINYAVNGTVNFRTKDPTPDVVTFYRAGVTNTGGGSYAFGLTGTVANGRLGIVAGVAGLSEPSAINNTPVYFDPGTGSGFLGTANLYPYGCNGINGSSTPAPLFGTGPNFYSRVYNHCTALATTTVSADFNAISQLFKLRYKLSDRTYLTGSYFGSQASASQSANLANVIPSAFQPGTGYHGSLPAGSVVDVLSSAYNAQPGGETNNEPIFQLELSTGFQNDTLLARYYHATINRIQTSGNPDPLDPYPQNVTAFGTLPNNYPSPLTFNGQSYLFNEYNYFNDVETDQLEGYSLEYTHPFTESNQLTIAGDFTNANSLDYYNDFGYGGNQCQVSAGPAGSCYNTSVSLPSGAAQFFTTMQLKDHEQFAPDLSGTFALYQDYYHSAYPTNCANIYNLSTSYQTTCVPSGFLQTYTTATPVKPVSTVPVSYDSTTHSSMAPRAALEWRPQPDIGVRVSAGASIAPPFLYVISQPNGSISPPSHPGPGMDAIETINAGNLRPETAFGYNAGADYGFKDGVTFLSGDLYLTNLFGQFLDETYPGGVCPPTACVAARPPTQLVYSQYVNLSNARYEGLELVLKRVPRSGIGFRLEGSTQRGYPYNLPPTFYCQFKITAAYPCIPSHYNVNLNILPGQNFYGEYINDLGSTTSGVDNQSVPYLQGNAELSYRLPNGAFALFGETLFGKNNSLNRPPFSIAYMSVNYPIGRDLAVQVSGYNIFNTYSGLFPVYGGGVTVPLSNGQVAGTIGNVLGPARYLFQFTKHVGP
jgi:TonB dependent receptor/Carboxypeptidase regulatory-like domain/TonB-dependent Receptor Plug Domain